MWNHVLELVLPGDSCHRKMLLLPGSREQRQLAGFLVKWFNCCYECEHCFLCLFTGSLTAVVGKHLLVSQVNSAFHCHLQVNMITSLCLLQFDSHCGWVYSRECQTFMTVQLSEELPENPSVGPKRCSERTNRARVSRPWKHTRLHDHRHLSSLWCLYCGSFPLVGPIKLFHSRVLLKRVSSKSRTSLLQNQLSAFGTNTAATLKISPKPLEWILITLPITWYLM